jgi:hypothetical protein
MSGDKTAMAYPSRPTPSPQRRDPRRALGRAFVALALALALATSGTLGCMVMDELDNAAAKMPDPANSKKKDPKSDPSGESLGAAGRLAAAKNALDERSKKWWQEAKTMTPGEKPAGIVRCRMEGGTRFMAKDDCIVQGGKLVDGAG